MTNLFLQTDADLAFFAQKEFQQSQLVRRLFRNFDIPIGFVSSVRPTGWRCRRAISGDRAPWGGVGDGIDRRALRHGPE
ncbi:pantoate--beta-alanine ligase [Mesorhizobium sp. M0494]|uniref:pantoate--beta-alanine ligase n=1 Tax=Mesorhizobium sp. M0494 TaxID=2956951 RepID=UPI00333E1814